MERHAAALDLERRLLMDRLGEAALGHSIFGEAKPSETPEAPEEELALDPAQELLAKMHRLRHRPAKLADELSREMRRGGRRSTGMVWGQQRINAALDAAERRGKTA